MIYHSICLQRMTRQQKQKKQIINQIQASLRRKKHGYETFLGVNSLELPPITNVVITFPLSQPNRKKSFLINSPKKNNAEKEMENILNFNNVDIKNITNKEGGKIFQARHLKILDPILERNGPATNFNLTVDQKKVKNIYHSLSIQKRQRRYKQQQLTIGCHSIQLSRLNCESEKAKLNNYLTVKQSPQIKKAKNYFVLDFLPICRQTKADKMTRFKSDLKNQKIDNVNLQRCSPWCINQEQQLII